MLVFTRLTNGRQLSLPALFTDSHEDHACGHVQAPHRPGDPAVHLGTSSLAMEQGHQADPDLGPEEPEAPALQPRTLAPLKGVSLSPRWSLVGFGLGFCLFVLVFAKKEKRKKKVCLY